MLAMGPGAVARDPGMLRRSGREPLVRILVLCLSLGLTLPASLSAVAQEGFGPGQGSGEQAWKGLSPDTRKQKREQYFMNLPEPQQQQLRENQRKFHALSPDQKRELCARFQEQNGYTPPACRDFLDL